MSTFTLAISSCHHFQFALIHGPDIPGSYAILLFIASDLASITSHIHNWVLFLLWLHLFILSGVISPLFSSSILDTYLPGEFIFQCHIFLPFHTVHGVLKARILGRRKDRNGMHLKEAEHIKKMWQEYTEELYKKDLHNPDSVWCDHLPRARHLQIRSRVGLRKYHYEQN